MPQDTYIIIRIKTSVCNVKEAAMPSIKVLTIEVLPDMLDAERHIREVDTANTLDDMCKWIFNGLPYDGQIDYTEVNVNGIHYDVCAMIVPLIVGL